MARRFRILWSRFLISLLALFVVIPIFIHAMIVGQVDDQLGFGYATPYVAGSAFRSPRREIFLVTRATPGKPLYDAGLRIGDRLRFHSTDTLYYLMISNQGRPIYIPIERDGRLMRVRMAVPYLKLWFSPKMTVWLKEDIKADYDDQ